MARIYEVMRYEWFMRTLLLKAQLQNKFKKNIYIYDIIVKFLPEEFREYM